MVERNQQQIDQAYERIVVGSVIQKPELYFDVDLRTDEFRDPVARALWTAITECSFDGVPVDPVSLAERAGQAHTPESVSAWKGWAADGLKYSYAAERVRESAVDSAVRDAARGIAVSEDYGSDLLAAGQQVLIELGLRDAPQASQPIGQVVAEVEAEARRRRAGQATKGAAQVLSGLPPLDEYLSIKRGGVVTIAGRPSMGKSSLGLWLALRFIEQGERVLLLSTESSREEVGTRILASLTLVPASKIASKVLSSHELDLVAQATATLNGWPLWIDDTRRELPRVCREVRRLKTTERITMVVVDHLQELSTGDKRPAEPRIELNRVLAGLRTVCREAPRATLMLVSQLSRGVDGRDDKRPLLSDLKESGTIEEMSDEVFLLYRAAYYRRDADRDVLEVACAKNRNGKTGLLRFKWRDDLGQVAGVLDELDHVWSSDPDRGVTVDGKRTASTKECRYADND